MKSNEYIEDRVLQHAIYVQRVAGGYVKELAAIFEQLSLELSNVVDSDDYASARRNVLLAQIQQIYGAAMSEFSTSFMKSIDEFAIYEAEFNVTTLSTASTAAALLPLEETIMLAVNQARLDAPMSNLTISQALSKFRIDKSIKAQLVISDAVRLNLTKEEAKKELQSLLNVTRAQSEALVRSSINLTANTARKAVYLANTDIIECSEYVAKLDGRTTDICRSLDTKCFPVGENPAGTLHWGCRSQAVAKLRKEVWKA